MNTLIVNAFGGPGVGKTTFAWEIASLCKKLDLPVEYICEYAKELVYEERFDILDNTMKNQEHIFYEQKKRIDRLIGKVRVVVTDSPILLSAPYAKNATKEFEQKLLDEFNKYDNLNFYIRRDERDNYSQIGRKESFEESLAMDNKIYNFLNENKVPFTIYFRDEIPDVIDKIAERLDDYFYL